VAFQIRQLQAADAADYRELRFEALESCPEAFSSSPAEDDGLPLARYEAALNTNLILGGFRNGRLEGVIAISRPNFVKMHHKAIITGIYVREGARGNGLSDELLKAAKKLADDGVEMIQFRVPESNAQALALCQRSGFSQMGTEPHALRLDDGRYVDQLLMSCQIAR
jgi:ribosomal protein S18 acetylase RimI-like enzyme